MRMCVAVFAAVMLVVVDARAQGINIIADTLADDCRHPWPDTRWIGCGNFLEGVLQTLRKGMVVRRDADGKTIVVQTADGLGPLCVAASLTQDRLVEAFVKFIGRHPEKRQDPAAFVAAEALIALDEHPPQGFVDVVTLATCNRNSR